MSSASFVTNAESPSRSTSEGARRDRRSSSMARDLAIVIIHVSKDDREGSYCARRAHTRHHLLEHVLGPSDVVDHSAQVHEQDGAIAFVHEAQRLRVVGPDRA